MRSNLITKEEFKTAQERLLHRFGVVADSHFLDIPSVSGDVHVLICGEGPPLVMVPGFGDPAAMWAPLMTELNKFTLYAVDRPCFGLTGSARYTTKTFRTLATRFLAQVLDGLQLERPVFVGNSIGSLWSIWLALDQPTRVAAMIHIGCPAFILDTSAPFQMRLLSFPPLGHLLMKLVPPSHKQVDEFASMVGEDLSDLPELKDLLVVMQKLPGVRSSILKLLHAVIGLRGVRPEVALTKHQLEQIPQPVQLIWGECDPFGAPKVGEQAAVIIPKAELHIIPKAGHVPWLSYAGQVGDLVRSFLHG